MALVAQASSCWRIVAHRQSVQRAKSHGIHLQVLGFLRAAHARGAALGRLRPSGLRVTGSCIVLLDPAAQIPADEEVPV